MWTEDVSFRNNSLKMTEWGHSRLSDRCGLSQSGERVEHCESTNSWYWDIYLHHHIQTAIRIIYGGKKYFSENMTVRARSWPLTHSSFEVKSVMSIHTKRSHVGMLGTEVSGAVRNFCYIRFSDVGFCPAFHYQSLTAVHVLKGIVVCAWHLHIRTFSDWDKNTIQR
jgi:hypothetical protein